MSGFFACDENDEEHTSECSLLCAPPTYRSELEARLQLAAQSPSSPQHSPVSIKLWQLELAFILSKGSHPQSYSCPLY